MFSNILSRLILRLEIQKSLQFSPKIRKRCYESGKKYSSSEPSLFQTHTLVQEGQKIQELPMIVQRIFDIGDFCGNKIEDADKLKKDKVNLQESKIQGKNQSNLVVKRGLPKSVEDKKFDRNKKRVDIETEEGTAILFSTDLEFLKNTDMDQVLTSLDLEPPYIHCGKDSFIESTITDEINCRVALQALAKIIELENYQYQKNFTFHERSLLKSESRDSVIKKLIDMIARSKDSEAIVVGLEILINDRVSPSRNIYRDRLRNEILIRAIDGDFNIAQLIDVVKTLSVCRDSTYREAIDLLWISFKIREGDISPENIVTLFKTLHFFKESKVMLLTILTNKLRLIYPKLSGSQMADILDVFHLNLFSSANLSQDVKNIASEWMKNYSADGKDEDLSEILESLKNLNHVDETMVLALENFVKIKGKKIKDARLVSAIMKYCMKVRVENSTLQEFVIDYFISKGKELPDYYFASILAPIGFFPNSSRKTKTFFEVLTEILNSRFSKLDSQNTLDILLTYIYAKKYPENLIDEKFETRMRRVLKKNSKLTKSIRKKLLIFDSVMALECEKYGKRKFGWIEKEDQEPSLPDLRIRQIINKIKEQLSSLVGGPDKIGVGMMLGGLPLIDFYNVDIIVYPTSIRSPVVDLKSEKTENFRAILIHLPEHLCFGTRNLIGPQMMRMRILRKLGFQIASLDYEILLQMKQYSIEMTNYLAKQISDAK